MTTEEVSGSVIHPGFIAFLSSNFNEVPAGQSTPPDEHHSGNDIL